MMLALAVDWNKLTHECVEGLVFAVIGILLLAVSFIVLDKLTPGSLWKELIDEHNIAIAVLLGAFALGISIIIAAAMVG
jgi:putative membrane protein